MKRLLVTVMLMAGLWAAPSLSEGLLPNIPTAIDEPHPEGNEYWRVNHPALLSHDRDQTVLEGIRDIDASLAACVSCHAVNGPNAAPVTIESDQHFCRVCHEYAAVNIDCFQCHNSVPDIADQAMLLPNRQGSLAELQAYLESISK